MKNSDKTNVFTVNFFYCLKTTIITFLRLHGSYDYFSYWWIDVSGFFINGAPDALNTSTYTVVFFTWPVPPKWSWHSIIWSFWSSLLRLSFTTGCLPDANHPWDYLLSILPYGKQVIINFYLQFISKTEIMKKKKKWGDLT